MIEHLDIDQLRQHTPACLSKIHLNNAGSSLPPISVVEAVQAHLQLEAQQGGYEAAAANAVEIEGFYHSAARLLHTNPYNIAYTSSATDSFAKALSAIPFQPGDVLLTTDDDYVSNQIAFLFLMKRQKIKVIRAATSPTGEVDVQSVKELIEKHTPRLVAVTHVPTNSGLVQPIEEIGDLCRKREIWYLVDACQSAGQMPLDVQAIGCDFLSGTMRKFIRGPRGAGFLFASDKALEEELEPVFPDMQGAFWTEKNAYSLVESARRFEYWEKPYALLLGSKAAIDYALSLGLAAIEHRVNLLSAYVREKLSDLPRARLMDKGIRKCGIITVAIEGWVAADFKQRLDGFNINTSISQRANALIDFHEKGVDWVLRISPHYYNIKEEIDALANALSIILMK